MLCPNCGTKTKTGHKFCRSCGMNLEPVARALSEHRSAGGGAPRGAARGAGPEALGRLLAGFFVIMAGVLLTALLPGKAYKFAGLALAVIGLIAMLVSTRSLPRTAEESGTLATPDASDAAAPATGRLLREQTFEPIPTSVTDRTTELLHAEIKDRKPRD